MPEERIAFMRYYEKLPVAVYICDRDDLLIDYNAAAAGLFNQLPETGSSDWYPLIKKYDQQGREINAGHKPITDAIRSNPDGYKQEFRFVMPGGEERFILISSVGIQDDFDDYDGAVHTFNDVTELRRSEQQQALLAAIVESSEDAIIAKNLEGIITSWNPAAERLFGYFVAEAIGKHGSLIIPPERITEEQMIIQKIRRGEMVDHFETERVNKSGIKIPISLTISPIKDRDGKIIGASKIARDITRLKEAEEQLQAHMVHLEETVARRTDELHNALKKERELGQLKSRFVSMASHEFRTPLSAIKLSASLIDKYAESYKDPQIVKHVSKIKNAVSTLSAILNDFLSLERLESGKVNVSLSKINLPDFCLETTAEMQMLSKPGQEIIYNHAGDSEIIVLDEQLLKNCLNNLLSNAIKYSDESTTIHLSTSIDEQECLISVCDKGIGIPESDQKNLFSPFFRAGNTQNIQGTGLGLNIVARYAALMGGSVGFVSNAGMGTTFTLRFSAKTN